MRPVLGLMLAVALAGCATTRGPDTSGQQPPIVAPEPTPETLEVRVEDVAEAFVRFVAAAMQGAVIVGVP
jgi:hypothetical protein